LLGRIDKIEYWFLSTEGETKVRHHKIVYFHLLDYSGGDTEDHDFEVDAAEWVPIDKAVERLTYENERRIADRAKEMIRAREKGEAER